MASAHRRAARAAAPGPIYGVAYAQLAADRPFYSGKHRKHGVNVQVIADPTGRLMWVSPALPGST